MVLAKSRLRIGMVVTAASVVGVAQGQDPTIGEGVRVDVTGGEDWANESTASASEVSTQSVVMGWNDYRVSGQVRSAFGYTLDGGQTWTDFLLRPPAAFQAGIEGDPMAAHDDRTGILWGGAITFGGSGLYVARLEPGETEFGPSVMAYVGSVDKCWMAAGPRPGEPDSTRLYIVANVGVLWSDDLGDTWTAPVSLGGGIGFLPRIGPDGELYVAYWDFDDGVRMMRSLDGGATFTDHMIAQRMDVWGTQDGSRFPGQFRVPSLNYLDVDPNSGVLYAVYFDTTSVNGSNSDVDLYFCKSEDQGTTWTTPVTVNAAMGDQFFPWVEVDQDGRIHIVYLDSRHTIQADDQSTGSFDGYYTYSEDGGDTWVEIRLTPQTWNNAGDGFLGDYMGMAVSANRVYPSYIKYVDGEQHIYTNVIEFPLPKIDADLNDDGVVDVLDLLIVILNFGDCEDCDDCPGNTDDDCEVDVPDLVNIITQWS